MIHTLLSLIILAMVLPGCSECRKTEPVSSHKETDPVFSENRAVAHALGGIDGVTYSNSLEAFHQSVELGFKLLEVDLMLVGNEVVCFHEGSEDQLRWRTDEDTTRWPAEYDLARYAGRYRVISARELLDALRDTEGIYLVTDTKGNNEEVMGRFVHAAQEIDERLVERIIPQIYHPEEATTVEEIGPFPRIILTLYQWNGSNAEVVEAVRSLGIAAVTMPLPQFSADLVAELRSLGALSYVHTVNEAEEIQRLLEQGVHGVYTDFDTSLLD